MPSKCPCHYRGIQQVTSETLRTRQFVTRHCRVITEAVRSTLTSELTKGSFIKSGIKFSKMSFVVQLVSLLLLARPASNPPTCSLTLLVTPLVWQSTSKAKISPPLRSSGCCGWSNKLHLKYQTHNLCEFWKSFFLLQALYSEGKCRETVTHPGRGKTTTSF